ncbi:hypothetical protein [Streptomyces inhibens]|uniref:hypothetical protein n=1 Tax=Streptomyces inhibens TaxID=2293571 RepID=UPI001EE6C38D|nr:hypothetical protein [Streptomyces inhibens]UKY47888.1 hypothetical protein KI385_02995 [Streptomyces inhibens]
MKAARSHLRFQDRRVADLEARITEPGSATMIAKTRACFAAQAHHRAYLRDF